MSSKVYYQNIILYLVFVVSVKTQEWVVNTQYGDVQGHWSEEYRVWRFVGIPYAAAPLGALRYKDPLPPTPWDGVLDAVNDTVTCHQSLNHRVEMETEDCLVINVFVPESARTQGPLPILFFIHGGGFTFGSGNDYNPYWTTRHDVILITFNYRIGPFGYLCLGTENSPGNMGFKDIIFALHWTNKNVGGFGGDPNSVTIYGESASGYQAHALVFTKAAEGLFHKAIIESGAALCHIGHNYDRLGMAKAVARDLGFQPVDDLDRLADFFANVPVDDLIVSTSVYPIRNLCVERHIDGVDAAIPERVDQAITYGNYNKVPMIFAFAELEGLLFSRVFYDIIDDLNNNFENYLPIDIFIPTDSEKIEVIRRIKEVYFGGALITEDSLLGYIEYTSDELFFNGIYRSVLQHALDSSNSLYMMEFSYRGGFNQPNPFPQFNAASHADIVAHVMDLKHYNNETVEQDQVVRDRMTEMWANFVKYGNPTPEGSSLGVQWPVFTAEEQSYLNVDSQLSVRQRPYPARTQLWADIYDRYFYPPPVFTNSGNKIVLSVVLPLCFVTSLILN